jgi:nucleoside-diphosphate-sugar epimerase
MKVCVTGGSGFVGRFVVRELENASHQVTVVTRMSQPTALRDSSGIRITTADVRDKESLQKAFAGQDTVINLAAAMNGDWSQSLSVGGQGTQNIVDAAVDCGISRLIHISSCVVYKVTPGEAVTEETPFLTAPWNAIPYDRQKVLSERLVWEAHDDGRIQVTTIRPPTVIGPGDPYLVPKMVAYMSSSAGDLADDGQNRFPYVVVDELAKGIVEAATRSIARGRAYNMCSRTPVKKTDLISAFRDAGVKPLQRSASTTLAIAGFSTGLRTLRMPYRLAGRADGGPLANRALQILQRKVRGPVVEDFVMDCTRAVKELNWKGTADLRDAAERTVKWHFSQSNAAL